jgi:hypothetical protein
LGIYDPVIGDLIIAFLIGDPAVEHRSRLRHPPMTQSMTR